MGRATIQSHYGTTLGSIKYTNLDSTDDIAILSASRESSVSTVDAFTNDQDPGLMAC